MNRLHWGGLAVVLALCLALAFSVATSWRDRQKLQAITAANQFVRKTLGEMMVAMADKDKEIDRLSKSPCDRTVPSGSRLSKD